MTWTRIDDTAPHHPKLQAAGAEASWFWVSALCFSNTHKCNGKIDKALVQSVYFPLAKKASRLAEKLCQVGLFHDRGDHYEIHDYAQYQDAAMKEQVEARRSHERERKRRQRAAACPGPVPDNVPPDVPDNVPAVSQGQLREGKGRIGQGRGNYLPGSTTLEPVPPTGDARLDATNADLGLKQPVRVVR